jgi:hypothetical protein
MFGDKRSFRGSKRLRTTGTTATTQRYKFLIAMIVLHQIDLSDIRDRFDERLSEDDHAGQL